MTKANWSTAGGGSLAETPTESVDTPSADAETTPPAAPPVKKRKGGLLTAAQLKEEVEAQAIEEARKEAERQRERAEMRRMKIEAGEEVSEEEGDDERPDHQQTIHRDRTGKIVDVNAERAEAQKREQEDRARQAAKKDWNKGLVQRNQRDEELRRERQAAGTSFARSVNLDRGRTRRKANRSFALLCRSAHDRSMNEEQRNEVRREDPAAAFLTVSSISSAQTRCDSRAHRPDLCCSNEKRKALNDKNIRDLHHHQIDSESHPVSVGMELVSRRDLAYMTTVHELTWYRRFPAQTDQRDTRLNCSRSLMTGNENKSRHMRGVQRICKLSCGKWRLPVYRY